MAEARAFMGAGDVYINRIVNGAYLGMKGPIYANKLEITPSVEIKEAVSKGRYDYGQVIASVNIPKPTEFTLELTEVNREILTMAFLGTDAQVSTAAGALADAPVVTAQGLWTPVGAAMLDDIMAVSLTAGGPPLVEGTDYRLNRPMGWILAIEGGAIAAGVTVYVSGNYSATKESVIQGSTNTEVRAHIIFDGINHEGGKQCKVDIWEAVLSADSAFDFLADDFGKVSLKGRLKTPQGKSAPYEVRLLN